MPAPGVPVLEGDRLPGNQRQPGQVDRAMFAGAALRGPTDRPIELTSPNDIAYWIGDPFGGSQLARALVAYFLDGGTFAYVARAADSTAASATANVPGAAGNVLVITADGPGTWANNLTVDVAAGSGSRKLFTVKESGTVKIVVEAGSTTEAIGRLATPGLIRVTAGSAAWPPNNTTSSIALSGGAGNDSAVTDANVVSSLTVFNRDLGPGTVAAPGWTTSTVHQALLRHAQTFNRHALCDLPDIADIPTLTASAAAIRALDSEKAARAGQLLWPWEVMEVGPYLNVPIPPSAGLAGRMARIDRTNPSRQARAAAGPLAVSENAIGVTRVPTDADWDTISDAGITLIRKEAEGVCAMDCITPVSLDRWPQYYFAAAHRSRLAIVDQARAAVRQLFLFENIDGDGVLIERVKGAVENVCNPYSQEPLGGLYSENGDLGYLVSITSSQAEIAAGKIRVQLSLRASPSVRMVPIEFTAVAVGDTLA